MDVSVWLRGLGLQQYAQTFADNAIDDQVLAELTDAHLSELGLPLGHRIRLLKAIRELGTVAAAAKPALPRAERRQLTVMFVDLVGSTALSARLDPEEMGTLIRVYQRAVGAEVDRFGGHVAQFLGDGVVVYLGWPRAHEDGADRAIRAGLAIVQAVGRLAAPTGEKLATRIGIATGLVVVGELAGEGAENAVTGDTPNLAARLQAVAAPGEVVVAATTRRLAGAEFEYQDLGPQQLKGFPEPVPVWRVIGLRTVGSRFEAHASAGTVMVGREQEIALLMQLWERAKAGEGQVLMLCGEPGIGKSRITRMLAERVAAEPHEQLHFQCSPHYTNSAFHPIIAQLERAAGFRRDDGPAARLDKLEALLARGTSRPAEAAALIAAMMSIADAGRYPQAVLTPQTQKERTVEVLVDQLPGLAQHRPVLCLFEDVHWIDPTTLEVLDRIVDRIASIRVLLVLTFRPEFAARWQGRPEVTQITLNRLGRSQSAALVAEVAGGKALPAEVLDQIVAKTDGVPLFVEELTKTVLEAGFLREAADRYELAGPLPPLAIPATLQDSLVARLDRLAPVKAVAQTGAAIGREFGYELLAAVSPLREAELRDALDQLVASELVFARGVPPHATYTFKHALVQDAAYQGLLKSRRRQLHAQIAKVLEDRFAAAKESQPELLSYHFAEAQELDKAVAYALVAGRRAAERSANPEAIAHYGKGLALLRSQPATPARDVQELAFQLGLISPLIASRGYASPEMERTVSRALALCETTGRIDEVFPILYGQFAYHLIQGQIAKALALAEEFMRLAQKQESDIPTLVSLRLVGACRLLIGDSQGGRAYLEDALAKYDRPEHQRLAFQYGQDLRVTTLGYLALCRWRQGDVAAARALADDAIAEAAVLAHANTSGVALLYCGAFLHQLLGEAEVVRRSADQLMALGADHKLPLWSATGRFFAGCALAATGADDAGAAQMAEGLAALTAIRVRLFRPVFLCWFAQACGRAGRIDEGLQALAEARSIAEAGGEIWFAAEISRLERELGRAAA